LSFSSRKRKEEKERVYLLRSELRACLYLNLTCVSTEPPETLWSPAAADFITPVRRRIL
jgi:hypothetical protein